MSTNQTASSLSIQHRLRRVPKVGTHERIKSLKNAEHFFYLTVVLDFISLNTSLLGGLGFYIPFGRLVTEHPTALMLFMLTFNALAILIASYTEVYRVFEGMKIELKIKDLFLSSIIFFGTLSLIYYQFFFEYFGAHFLIPAFCIFLFLGTVTHLTVRYLSRNFSNYLTYAVVGGGVSDIDYLEEAFTEAYGKRTVCIGRFADQEISRMNKLGNYQDIKSYIQQGKGIHKLLYVNSKLSQSEVQEIAQICRNRFIDFEVVPPAVNFFQKQVLQIDQLSQLPIFRRKKEPLCLLKNKVLKRTFDILFSLAVILFIFPWLVPIIAILIKLESPGPIFFKQKRTGYWSKSFTCLKFRSMVVNKNSDKLQAVKSDCRITKMGALMRKTSIDELPQFFNVLRGDMSIVGPRPHMLKHTEEYSKLIDSFMIRHAVKPGITGWAQVNGWRGPTPEVFQMVKRVEYDVDYIENWGFWLDLKCIFLTVFNVFKGEKNAI